MSNYVKIVMQMASVAAAATMSLSLDIDSVGRVLTLDVPGMRVENLKFSTRMVVLFVSAAVKLQYVFYKWITSMAAGMHKHLNSEMVMFRVVVLNCTSGSKTTTSLPASEFFVPIAT